jgi:hypothetical protein
MRTSTYIKKKLRKGYFEKKEKKGFGSEDKDRIVKSFSITEQYDE